MPVTIQSARPDQWREVAHLIYHSTNAWYEKNRGFRVFAGDPDDVLLFCRTYAALDGAENLLIAWDSDQQKIVGSCFVHPRKTHLALGILNVHPESFGQRVAVKLLTRIVELAREQQKALRLVSSAMNLDSFSLYSKFGFAPYAVYQDLMIPDFQPENAQLPEAARALLPRIRLALSSDVPAIEALDRELTGLEHAQDYAYFIRNPDGAWKTWVLESDLTATERISTSGESALPKLDGVLSSVRDPGSCMLGPGLMRNEDQMLALIHTAYSALRDSKPVFLVPSTCTDALRTLYRWGTINTEIHLGQSLEFAGGARPTVRGLIMPTFMPES